MRARHLHASVPLLAMAVLAGACDRAAPSGPSGCDAHVAETERLLDQPQAFACAADADCACFNGGLTTRAGCGGVANTRTAAALEAARSAYLAAGCPQSIQCAAWSCTPRCVQGRCSQ